MRVSRPISWSLPYSEGPFSRANGSPVRHSLHRSWQPPPAIPRLRGAIVIVMSCLTLVLVLPDAFRPIWPLGVLAPEVQRFEANGGRVDLPATPYTR